MSILNFSNEIVEIIQFTKKNNKRGLLFWTDGLNGLFMYSYN